MRRLRMLLAGALLVAAISLVLSVANSDAGALNSVVP